MWYIHTLWDLLQGVMEISHRNIWYKISIYKVHAYFISKIYSSFKSNKYRNDFCTKMFLFYMVFIIISTSLSIIFFTSVSKCKIYFNTSRFCKMYELILVADKFK